MSSEKQGSDTSRDRVGTKAPAAVEKVDLEAADECPACGGTAGLMEIPVGYYHCKSCWTTWGGDYDDARLVDYQGPEVTT